MGFLEAQAQIIDSNETQTQHEQDAQTKTERTSSKQHFTKGQGKMGH
jgi:hypothetical protein